MKTYHRLTCTLLLLLIAQAGWAQYARFVFSGTITYEKRVNMYAKIQKMMAEDSGNFMQQLYDQYRKTQPQFITQKASLAFNRDNSLYTPIADANAGANTFISDPSTTMKSVVFTDIHAGSSISEKNIYDEIYLVRDSLRKIAWKITDETREIAGYDCRRANALIMDSIYVVAFYTDQIPVSVGPESFTGLPGMILGIALPYENTTWFATQVEDAVVPASAIVAPQPKKSKTVDRKGLQETLLPVFKNWGRSAQSMLKAILL